MPVQINIRNYPGCRVGLILARKAMGLSQKELAKKAHMSRSILEQLELGKRGTKQETWDILKNTLMAASIEDLWRQYDYKDGKFIGRDGFILKDPSHQGDKIVRSSN